MKTIKQLAEEMGISKQALNKRIDKLGCRNQLIKNGNTWLIPESLENTIKNTSNQQHRQPTQSATVDALVDTLIKQLEEKDKQIEQLQKALDQEQQLHALAQQKVMLLEQKSEEPKSRWKFWK